MERTLDFARPIAPQRLRVYLAVFVFGCFVQIIPFFGVGFGWLPPEPTYGIWGALIYVPLLVPPFLAWKDMPGENRTWLERASEFTFLWFPVTASSQILWEIPWLIGDLTGVTNGATEHDRWLWFWWGYGAADTRYITGYTALFAMEVVAVIGGLMLFYAWFKLMKAKQDHEARIKALFLAIVAEGLMLAVVTIYYVDEFRAGFSHLEQGFWYGFMFKFIFMNMWWFYAPLLTIPFMIKQIDYLYRHHICRVTPETGQGSLRGDSSDVPDARVGADATTLAHDHSPEPVQAVRRVSRS